MTVLNTRWRFDKKKLKIRQTLFTFKLHAEEHFHFDDIFYTTIEKKS